MRFGEVIKALSEGKPVRRTSWDKDYFVYYGVHYGQLIEQYTSDDYGKTCATSPFDMVDFLADDWEILNWDRGDKR